MRNRVGLAFSALGMCLVAAVSAIVIPQVANAGVSGSVGNGPMVFQSGEYTPTATAVLNVAAATPSPAQWTRVGDVVTVSGQITVQVYANGATLTRLRLSLPVASNLVNFSDATGVGIMDDNIYGSPGFRGRADAPTDTIYWDYYSQAANTTNAFNAHYTAQYRVR